MAERFVPLSSVEYFAQGNTMMGSLTPESLVADPLAKVFNYRVGVQDGALTAEAFIDNRCYELTDREGIVRADFALSEQGIDEAAAWLQSVYLPYAASVNDKKKDYPS